jgi:hypothetical protein
MLLSMMANTGVLNCYGVPRKPGWQWIARARGAPGYRGETHLLGTGTSRLDAWSPNRIEVALAGVSHDATLVYNMHHFPGWHGSVDGRERQVAARGGLVTLSLPPGARRAVLWYRPPGLWWGTALALSALALTLAWWRRQRAWA